MEIKTKFNIKDQIKFRPFDDKTKDMLFSEIYSIEINVYHREISIKYNVVDKNNVTWNVPENCCYLFKKVGG